MKCFTEKRYDGVEGYTTRWECKPCRNRKYELTRRPRDWRTKNLKKYGLTKQDYLDLMIKQEGRCNICRKEKAYTLVVDHDHKTGRVRGLLCYPCNSFLGCIKDNPANLIAHLANG